MPRRKSVLDLLGITGIMARWRGTFNEEKTVKEFEFSSIAEAPFKSALATIQGIGESEVNTAWTTYLNGSRSRAVANERMGVESTVVMLDKEKIDLMHLSPKRLARFVNNAMANMALSRKKVGDAPDREVKDEDGKVVGFSVVIDPFTRLDGDLQHERATQARTCNAIRKGIEKKILEFAEWERDEDKEVDGKMLYGFTYPVLRAVETEGKKAVKRSK